MCSNTKTYWRQVSTNMKQRNGTVHTLNTLGIMQLQYWLELLGFVLRRLRFVQ